MKPTTKFALLSALFDGKPLTLVRKLRDDVAFTCVNSVEREDGSGRCWNVTGQVRGRVETHFVRTLD